VHPIIDIEGICLLLKLCWDVERKRMMTWRVRCLDSEEKLNKRIWELEKDYDNLKEKYDGAVGELDDLKNNIIQEYINDFEKGLRQAAFFHGGIDVTDVKFDVNKDVIDGRLVNEDEGSDGEEPEAGLEEKAAKEVNKAVDAGEIAPDAAE